MPVKSVGVLGAGTMGSGIAVCLLSAGLPVVLLEQNEKVGHPSSKDSNSS